jgi:hypothetical protein
MKNLRYAVPFYFFIFGYLFFFTLNCNYIEGDDASTILYHLIGRNPEIQKPYAPYNSGFDFILEYSGLTTELSLRNFSFLVSFVTGFLTLVLFALFLETLYKDSEIIKSKERLIFYLLLPFIIPDILFHSLVLNSTNISLVFILLSLIYFIKFIRNQRIGLLILSMVLFAISIPFRWTMLIVLPLYIGLFLYFYPLQKYAKQTWRLLFMIMIANVGGLLLALCLIGVTGYDFTDILKTISGTTDYMEKSEISVLAMLASGTAFLTPAFLLLILFSGFKIWKENNLKNKTMFRFSGCLLLSISPFVLLGFYPLYKYSISLMPIILMLCVFGLSYAMQNKWRKIIFITALILPWIIGVQIDATGTFCGPGFELNTHKTKADHITFSSGNNPDSRIKIEKVRLAFDSGFYMPMPEGPRPMYGYLYVLFGGDWKNQIAIFTNERREMFDYLQKYKNAAYFQDRMSAYFSCDLYRNGFTTKTNFIIKDGCQQRVFKKEQHTIVLKVVPENNKVKWISAYFKDSQVPVVYRSSYSTDILKLQGQQGNGIKIIGPFTAISEK